MIRLAVPSIDESDLAAVAEVLASGYLVQGRHVAEFEAAVARSVGSEHAVAVTNCTAALHLALLALEVGPGSRVALPTYSWPATANVVELVGAEPVFVDLDRATYNLDPNALEGVLRSGQRLDAILPVHAFGGMADMRAITSLADEYGVPVVEDAACALGSELAGRPAGSWGTLGCFSFHPRKAVTTGEGGMITTDDAELARALRMLRNHGLDPASPTPDFLIPGFNTRLTDFQAALGVTQMAKLDRLVASRRRQAGRYSALLQGTTITPPGALDASVHVYQSYVVLLPADAASRRAEIISGMREDGVETTIGTYHMPLVTYYRRKYGYEEGDFPVTDDVAARGLSLPLHETLGPEQQEEVVQKLLDRL